MLSVIFKLEERNNMDSRTWVTYGLVVKLPFCEIDNLKKLVESNGYRFVYDLTSLYKIRLVEELPSPSFEGDAYGES